MTRIPDVFVASPSINETGPGIPGVMNVGSTWRGRKIVTDFVYPPIPVRSCDWQAMLDGDEPSDDGPSPPVGRGATEEAAIADLISTLEDNMPKILCIYHANCADGFGAAWVVRNAIGAHDVDFHRGVYGEAPPDVTGRDVIMVDFSYKRPVLDEMIAKAASFLVLDHHKTAAADLAGLPPARSDYSAHAAYLDAPGCSNVGVLFDMDRSGAGLTWDYFNPGKPRPALINHIEDRDLWRFKLPGTREIQAAVFSYPYDFDLWTDLMYGEMTVLAKAGADIERKHFKDIDELLKVGQRRMTIAGHDVPVCNLPYTMSSDAGHAMGKGEPFAACYMDTPAGRVFSLRSAPEGVDVSEIAKLFGGGGHKNAAGFTVPHDTDVSKAGLQAAAPAAAPSF